MNATLPPQTDKDARRPDKEKEIKEKSEIKLSALLGIKGAMCRIFKDEDEIPCTAINVPVNFVVGVKTDDADGYSAVKVALAGRKANKPVSGSIRKSGLRGVKIIREIRGNFSSSAGDKIFPSDVFKEGDRVAVTGFSKGRGFASTRKRWGFKGGPKSHGQSNKYHSPGSIGASSYPSRVLPGMKMAGRMGGSRVTVKNLTVAEIDEAGGRIFIKGAVPGSRGEAVVISKIKQQK